MSNNQSGDRLVDAKAILEAIAELKRRGNSAVMAELELIEGELANHVMEELGLVHQELMKTGARAKLIRRVFVQVESLVLVSVLALRNAQQRLWQDADDAIENDQIGPNDPLSSA
jgi:hypothetical protein